MPASIKEVPQLETFDATKFRQKLAGLIDPTGPGGAVDKESIKREAISFFSWLPLLYGDDLDRMKLWEKIVNVVNVACAKVSDGDTMKFFGEVTDGIKANPGKVARLNAAHEFLSMAESQTVEWRQAFVRYCKTHTAPLSVFGRAEWERTKERMAAEKKGEGEPTVDYWNIMAAKKGGAA